MSQGHTRYAWHFVVYWAQEQANGHEGRQSWLEMQEGLGLPRMEILRIKDLTSIENY